MKLDPIIAVHNVESSSTWYQSLFGWNSKHGGNEFDILVDTEDQVVLCLHKWGEHNHPTMTNASTTPGNGLILYFRTEYLDEIRNRVAQMNHPVEKEIEVNPNSKMKEFSLRDLDGYYLTISEYHTFGG